MKAPGFSDAEQREAREKLHERLIVLPEAKPPRVRRPVWVAIAIGAILALVIGASVGFAFQRKQVRIARADTVAAQRDLDTARAGAALAAAGAETKITDLQAQVSTLTDQLTIAENAKNLATVGKSSADRRISKLTTKLTAAQAALSALIGPRLHHGWHIGYVVLVGASQSPDRIEVDLGRWFTGAEAHQAAIADGVITSGEHLPNPRYLRNTTHDFRSVNVTFSAQITLRHYKGATRPTSVTLTTLESIFGSRTSANETVRLDPFWIHITAGEVDAMRQQQYP